MLLAEIAKDRGTEDREGQTEGGREGSLHCVGRGGAEASAGETL